MKLAACVPGRNQRQRQVRKPDDTLQQVVEVVTESARQSPPRRRAAGTGGPVDHGANHRGQGRGTFDGAGRER